MTNLSGLHIAKEQIIFSRQYTLSLLADIEDGDWFRIPQGCTTHVGWQVGHLAMAQYGLCLFRQRGRAETDAELMSASFRKQYSRGSQPELDPTKNPTPEDLRSVLERVHAQAMKEMPSLTESQLAEPVDMPYAVAATKLGALFFCSHHEMIHAGQIGLLRRLMGKSSIR